MDLTKLRFNVDTVALDEAIKKLDEVAAATKEFPKPQYRQVLGLLTLPQQQQKN